MQIVSKGGDNLHEMSNPVFWEKYEKNVISLSSAELGHRVVKVKAYVVGTHLNYIDNSM